MEVWRAQSHTCHDGDMTAPKTLPALAALALAVGALTGCTAAAAPQAEDSSTPVASSMPTPATRPQLPEWARGNSDWLIYPEGMECEGTEGCPNDYRAFFGEPGSLLPEGVQYYDADKHDCVLVQPLGVTCPK